MLLIHTHVFNICVCVSNIIVTHTFLHTHFIIIKYVYIKFNICIYISYINTVFINNVFIAHNNNIIIRCNKYVIDLKLLI